MQVPAFMVIGEMHERAHCLWRGNRLRIENRALPRPGSPLPALWLGRQKGGWLGRSPEGKREVRPNSLRGTAGQGRGGRGRGPRFARPVNGFQGGGGSLPERRSEKARPCEALHSRFPWRPQLPLGPRCRLAPWWGLVCHHMVTQLEKEAEKT